MPRPARFLAGAAVLAFLGTGLAACGSPSRSPSAKAPATTAALSADQAGGGSTIPPGTVLDIGDQQQLIETLFKASGVGADLPYKANFVEFGSGPLVDSGFAAGRIDVGFLGDLPAALAVSSGLPVRATAAEEGVGANMFLIAKPGVASISALKGRSVAYTTGTAQQAFALRALATVGLKQPDVHQVNVTLQQLFTVLETGSVDAAVITGVQEERLYLQQHPAAKVLATNKTVTPATYAYTLATTSALANPAKHAAILDFTRRLVESSNWAVEHPRQYATDYLVDVEHETQSEADLGVQGGLIEDFVPLTQAEPAALQNVVDLEYSAGAIPKRFDVSPLFDPAVEAAYNDLLQRVPSSRPAAG